MKTVVILGPKGGCGKTTMVRNLASAAVCDGLAVATLDTDPQGTLSDWHKKRATTGAPEVVGFHVAIREAANAVASAEGGDVILVDTPPAVEDHAAAVKALVLAADLVLMPSQPSPDDVRSVQKLMPLVLGCGKPGLFVLNRVKPRVKEVAESRRELAKIADVAGAAIPDSIDIIRAVAAGVGVVETGGRGSEDFSGLWVEVRRRVGL